MIKNISFELPFFLNRQNSFMLKKKRELPPLKTE